MKSDRKHRFDGEWQDLRVEVRADVHGSRNLRAAIMEMVYYLTEHPEKRALLVLVDSRITRERLQEERRLTARAIRPEIVHRLFIASGSDGEFQPLPQDLGGDFRAWLNDLAAGESPRRNLRDSYYIILQILMRQWILGGGPVTRAWLGAVAGCSYPTVAAALRRLDPYLLRHSDRRIELKYFPRDEWAKLMAVSNLVRETARFGVEYGESRSPEAYLDRLKALSVPGLAVGGIPAARHYYPDIDLVGIPRLDLSLHRPRRGVNLDFVNTLDPALGRIDDSLKPAAVVIHLVRRVESFFTPREVGLQWVDPVECLMDLEEAHLDRQAKQLFHALESERERSR